MNQNVIIKSVGTYHPSLQRDNSYYINYFKERGTDVSGLLRHLGRDKRYVADTSCENVVTMSYEASLKALESANVAPEEIDLVIFATDFPEQLVPTNATLLREKLHATNANQIFDMNTNCIGMLASSDVASRILLTNPRISKALITGCTMSNFQADRSDPVCYSTLGDAAAAIVLEKVEEPVKRGIIDTNYKSDPIVKDAWLFPASGMTKMYNNPAMDQKDKMLKLKPFDTSFICQEWVDLMDVLFYRYDVSKHDIKQYFFSQFSRPDAETTLKLMGLSLDKYTFIGEKYGYTGLTSPILAFDEALKNGSIGNGDNIMFCSVAAGYNICALLYKM